MPEPDPEDPLDPFAEQGESPLHGYRGPHEAETSVGIPAGLSVAISREAGSRGAAIAKRAAKKLGWEIYSQELLDFMAQDATVRKELLDKLPAHAGAWIEAELKRLLPAETLSREPLVMELMRLVLALGARGNVVLLGRGAGHLLPARTTLHVRLVAPLADRIAYLSQWMRLTEAEAAEQIRRNDERRAEFVAAHFQREPNDPHAYDMVLNSSLLGEERCADLIVAAARAKMSAGAGLI